MIKSIIAAYAQNRIIGKDNQLIWRLPSDLRYFKKLTTGHHIIMGRKTYLSIGKALPQRTTIIITRNFHFKASGCIVVHSLEKAFQVCESNNENEVFICGGSSVYQQALPLCDRMYITEIYHEFRGDAFFPDFDINNWQIIKKDMQLPDEKNPYKHSFITYQRK